MKKDKIFLVLAIAATAFIFCNSLQNASLSSDASGGLLDAIINIFPFLTSVLNIHILRKAAHITEFFTQGTFLMLWAACSKKGIRSNLPLVAFLGLFTACCDEFLQTFSEGRSPEVKDVFIDFTGTALAMGIVILIFLIRRRRRTNG